MAMEGDCSRVDVHLGLVMRLALFGLLAVAAMAVEGSTPVPPPLPIMPLPSYRQLRYQRQEQVMFFHFGVNTFAGNEQGDGTDDPSIFNPEGLVLSFYPNAMASREQSLQFVSSCGFASILKFFGLIPHPKLT